MLNSDLSNDRLLVSTTAPGRVNLIGEHTDYNGGFVLPLALPLETRTVAVARSDDQVYVTSLALEPGSDHAVYRLGHEHRTGTWIDYIQGITHILAQAGHSIRGFELDLSSSVPVGSGLSSSAALEVSILRALRILFKLDLDDTALALLAHRVETEFVGAQVGIMDQMVASLGDTKHALFLDTRTLRSERIPLPSNAAWLVVNSGVTHSHAGGEYNSRRRECTEAARLLDIACLSDLKEKDLERVNLLPDPLNRRARHVITENQRVLDTVSAIERGDLARIGDLFYASHASMRDDYEVSIPEIDFLVDALKRESGVYGARLTGGGFGGCIVILARPGEGREAARRVSRLYRERFGRTADILLSIETP